jgi:hypothetical protein
MRAWRLAAPLHEPAHVCTLMHVGAVQASTRLYQERPLRSNVSTALQVRYACWSHGMSCPRLAAEGS